MNFASDRAWRWGRGVILAASCMVLAGLVAIAPTFADDDAGVDNDAVERQADDTPSDGEPEKRPSDESKPEAEGDEEEQPARVIVRAGRNQEAMGHLKLKDESVIVVETLRGEIKSFPAMRVLDVIYLVDPEPGQEGIVLLRDGQSREGIIIEDDFEHVILEVEGIRTRLLRETVDRVILKPTFQQQYEQFVSTLDPSLPQRTILMCRWLMDQRRYDLAKKHLEELIELADDPRKIPDASRLLRVVEAQLALQQAERIEEEKREATESESHRSLPDDGETGIADDFPGGLLSRDEVNLIRVYEIDFENPPRISIRPETIRRLISESSTHPAMPTSKSARNKLYRADAADVLKLMFEVRARDLYSEVRVHTEPQAMNTFRRRVHDNWLLNNCASCHSGPDAGRFYLHRRGYRDERVRYTNFMILERLEVDSQWPLINYAEPEMSLIIQYGMPRQDARLPHPEADGWQPVFGRGRDRLKRESIQWIESMMKPRPEYPIDYQPPHPDRDGRAENPDDVSEVSVEQRIER